MKFTNDYGPVRVEADEVGISLIPGGSAVETRVVSGHVSTLLSTGFAERSGVDDVTVTASLTGSVVVTLSEGRVDPFTEQRHVDVVSLTLTEATAALLAVRLDKVKRASVV